MLPWQSWQSVQMHGLGLKDIKKQIPGVSTGFNIGITKPWTEEEQKDAVNRNRANDFYKEVFNLAR